MEQAGRVGVRRRLAWYAGEPDVIRVVWACTAHGYQMPCGVCGNQVMAPVYTAAEVAEVLTAQAERKAVAYGPESGVPWPWASFVVGEFLQEAQRWRTAWGRGHVYAHP